VKLLLDTHALLWWLSDDPRLGKPARGLIADPGNDILVSMVALWKIVVKVRIGKFAADIGKFCTEIEAQAFAVLDVTPAHLLTLAELPTHHRDPFDHLLIAQAISEGAVFMSEDANARSYAVKCVARSDRAPSAHGRRG
jgi:PIN domain nuclease of toxin-antitoxin system